MNNGAIARKAFDFRKGFINLKSMKSVWKAHTAFSGQADIMKGQLIIVAASHENEGLELNFRGRLFFTP